MLFRSGKDVEDLFTAVLSPAAAPPPPVPQPPAPPLLPVHGQGTSPLDKCRKYGPAVHAPSRCVGCHVPVGCHARRLDGRGSSFVLMG